MEFKAEYLIDKAGIVFWHQGLRIVDEGLKAAYRQDMLVNFSIEISAGMGVMVGAA